MSQERKASSERQTPVIIEDPTPQQKGTSFLRERDEYISSLHRVIAQARESSALCSPCPPNRALLSTKQEITIEQLSPRRASLERQAPLTTEQQVSLEQRVSVEARTPMTPKRRTAQDREAPAEIVTPIATKQQTSQERSVSIEAEIPITPDQERRASFLRKRDEYISSLEQVIARARENSMSCSPHPTDRSVSGELFNSSFASAAESITSTIDTVRSFITSDIFEESESEALAIYDDSRLSKRPASSREERIAAKRVALGVLDSNTKRSPQSTNGRTSVISTETRKYKSIYSASISEGKPHLAASSTSSKGCRYRLALD
jgi:hypothetical protein